MKEDIRVIINRMAMLEKLKKIIGEINNMHPMDVSVEMELGDTVKKDELTKRIRDQFNIDLSSDELSKTMTVLDLCMFIEDRLNEVN